MKNKPLVLGCRKSRLALAQAKLVEDSLRLFYPRLEFELKTLITTGDKILDKALNKIGDQGLFTKEIEEALLGGKIDLAIHSLKDLPVELPKGLEIGAVPKREDPRDVLVSLNGFSLESLPKGANIGTSSLRRSAQLLNIRPDLNILSLRGNLDTRIKKLELGSYDAIVLAYAGIKRLGLDLKITPLAIEKVLPQAGQGALGIEIRSGDLATGDLVRVIDDYDSHLCVDAERAVLLGLGGGCSTPIGVYARVDNQQIILKAGVFSLDGKVAIRDEAAGRKEDAQRLAQGLAERMLKKGTQEIIENLKEKG
ncbi:MAG: hydroxymethylbilane synthase [Candidatus Omnitrophota bacterium]|nr:hydroxymethylbilane synthase [Candidatus Omnitrophota bacterium]